VKCYYCKNVIDPEDLELMPKKDKQKNIKYKKDGTIDFHTCHKTCIQEKQIYKQKWENLDNYIKEKFFNIAVPARMYMLLKELHIEADIIQKCFESIENNLLSYISKKVFKDDVAKANYIFGALKNNINTFNENYQKQLINEKIKSESEYEVINTANSISFEFKAPKSINKLTLDFLC